MKYNVRIASFAEAHIEYIVLYLVCADIVSEYTKLCVPCLIDRTN